MSFLIGPGALGVVGVIKLYLEENFDFQKIWNWKQVCSDVWTWTKMLKQWSQFLSKTVLFNSLLLLKWPTYSCCFVLEGNRYFLDFLQKKFYNIDLKSFFRWLKFSFLSTFLSFKRSQFVHQLILQKLPKPIFWWLIMTIPLTFVSLHGRTFIHEPMIWVAIPFQQQSMNQ